jgi:hypothetical protein
VASWLGVLASYRGNRFPVFQDALPPGHAVVIATNDRRPAFLKDMPPVEQPTLSMVAHPQVPGARLLLVLGKDDAQVQTAAAALALGKAALSGQSMRVTGLELPPPRKAYDAPCSSANWWSGPPTCSCAAPCSTAPSRSTRAWPRTCSRGTPAACR